MNSQLIESDKPEEFDRLLNEFLILCGEKFFIPHTFEYTEITIRRFWFFKTYHRSMVIIFQKVDHDQILKMRAEKSGIVT